MGSVWLFPDDNSPVVGFDATKVENHDFESTLTKNPVESGGSVTDHVIVEPKRFSCTVIQSNTPVSRTFENEGAVGPITFHLPNMPPTTIPFDMLFPSAPVPQPNMVTGFQIMNAVDRVKRTLDRLDALRLAVQTMSIGTSKHWYESMVLTKISMPIEKVDSAEFTLTFEELVIVTTDQVTAPKPKEPRAAPMTNKGAAGDPVQDALDRAQAMLDKLKGGGGQSILYGTLH